MEETLAFEKAVKVAIGTTISLLVYIFLCQLFIIQGMGSNRYITKDIEKWFLLLFCQLLNIDI